MDQQVRRCIGSKTFGIEPHDAPISDFPVQPSQKDGLGRLCKPHWREYTGALRKAAQARKAAAQEASPGTASDVSNAVGDGADPGTRNAAQEDAPLAQEPVQPGSGPGAGEAIAQVAASVPPAKVRTPRTRRPRAAKGDPTVLAAADALLRATETLEGEVYTQAMGSDEVQAALETLAAGRTEKPLGETIEAGTEDVDAA